MPFDTFWLSIIHNKNTIITFVITALLNESCKNQKTQPHKAGKIKIKKVAAGP